MRRVAVIDAGAAGSVATIFAASAEPQTLLLERTEDGGRKTLISGVVVHRDLTALFGWVPILGVGRLPRRSSADRAGNWITPDQR